MIVSSVPSNVTVACMYGLIECYIWPRIKQCHYESFKKIYFLTVFILYWRKVLGRTRNKIKTLGIIRQQPPSTTYTCIFSDASQHATYYETKKTVPDKFYLLPISLSSYCWLIVTLSYLLSLDASESRPLPIPFLTFLRIPPSEPVSAACAPPCVGAYGGGGRSGLVVCGCCGYWGCGGCMFWLAWGGVVAFGPGWWAVGPAGGDLWLPLLLGNETL